jgi:hypothetical protein
MEGRENDPSETEPFPMFHISTMESTQPLPKGGSYTRGAGTGTWLRDDANNTVAASFGDSLASRANLSCFRARRDLRAELGR